MQTDNKTSRIDWPVALFLIITPAVAIASLIAFCLYWEVTWELVVLFACLSFASSVSITAGYHRLLAHRAYQARGWLKNLFLFFGAGAFQGSALKWVADHRIHHRHVDTGRDPYNIKRGFVFAHIGWLFYEMKLATEMVGDLQKDRWIAWQHRYYLPVAIFSGFLFPMLVMALWSELGFWHGLCGGFVFGAVTRIVFVHHCTFFINSLCHMWGKQPYNEDNSARDNFVLALLTNGEGYHNFHHRFQFDYRNGVRWYQWDPTKWCIGVLALFGQTYSLRRVPRPQILVAMMALKRKSIEITSPALSERLDLLRGKVEAAQERLKELSREYQALKHNLRHQSRVRLLQLKADLKIAKIEFDKTYQQWNLCLRAARIGGLAAQPQG